MRPRRGRSRPGRGPAEPFVRDPDAVPLTRYARFARRHLVLFVVLPVLFGGAGLLTAVLAPKTYVSTVNVLAPRVPLHIGQLQGPGDDEEAREPRPSTVDTEAQLVRSDEVLARLATVPGFRASPAVLRGRISITVPPNTRVLEIGVAAATPEEARDGAAIVGESYLNLRHQILGGVRQRNRESLARRESVLKEQLEAFPDENASQSQLTTRTRRQAVQKQLKDVRNQLAAIDGADLDSGEIIRYANVPQRTENRRRDVALSTGAAAGLTLALGAALLRDRRPRRMRDEEGVVLRTDIPVFGSTSPGEADRDGTCRRLRNLVFDEDARCVLLAGAPADAAMPVARELARLCANGGASSILLVLRPDGTDADVQTSRAFPETANCTRRTVRITDGDRSLRDAVERARAEAEIVIITGPELDSVDTLTLATFCDLTVVVAERETTIDVEVARGISVLAETAVPARGLILAEPAAR
ncbi:hypothetical protein [Actinomadura algeriensis]|uniref:Capsular polysaccharide biosynthesis protein n=1 Tax=Actinomadura algeriensis TaxID=1679523 RepID=A0ABR9JUL3_9ACTN|nr:hypothetical protein [Actinomadura algeriensis]MBE1534076.1 capsular polysaccharide biosynthesis protein [Actinomadura algeriensis]